MRRAVGLWGPVAAYMVLIFLGSELSRPPDLGPDSYAHVAEYALLGLLMARALGPGLQQVGRRTVLIAWVASSLYGVSDELHQAFVPFRHSSLRDVGMDAIGSLLGAGLAFSIATALRVLWPHRSARSTRRDSEASPQGEATY